MSEGGRRQRARRRGDGGRDARVVVRQLEQPPAAGLAHLALYGEQRLAPARLAARCNELNGIATLDTHARLQIMLEDVHTQRRVLRREEGAHVSRTLGPNC